MRHRWPATMAVDPVDEAFSGGMIDTVRRSLFDWWVESPVGNRRDWQRIGIWTDTLGRRLAA